MRKVAESTVRRLSLYLRFLEEFEGQGIETVSSGALASRGGTTSAQVRKDLSFFGSFGKRGLGYPVPELADQMRGILGLKRRYRVGMIGAGKIGSALVQYRGLSSGASTSSPSSIAIPPRSDGSGTASRCSTSPRSRRSSRASRSIWRFW